MNMKIKLFFLVTLVYNISFSQNFRDKLDQMIEYYDNDDNKYSTIANELLNNKYGKIDNETRFYCEYFLGYELILKDEFKLALDKYKSLLKFCELNTIDDTYGNLRKCIKDIKSRVKSLDAIVANLPVENTPAPEINNTISENSQNNFISEPFKDEDNKTDNNENKTSNYLDSNYSNKDISNNNKKTVTLTVSGTGKTIEEARLNALRSAIEQAFGVFISSKTEILNDNLVKDEIVSISNGNIQNYDLVSQVEIPENGFDITIKATVSIDKLTSFAESKGIEIEFKGGLFAQNIKLQKLNEDSEFIAIKNFCYTGLNILLNSIDYNIQNSEPKILNSEAANWKYDLKKGLYIENYDENDYEIDFFIEAKSNNNLNLFYEILSKLLLSLNMSDEEILNYKKINKKIIEIEFDNQKFYLRNTLSAKTIHTLFFKASLIPTFFSIDSNIETFNNIFCFNWRRETDREYHFVGNTVNREFPDRKDPYFINTWVDGDTYVNEFKDINKDFNEFKYEDKFIYNNINKIRLESNNFHNTFKITRFFSLEQLEKIDNFKVKKINIFEDISKEISRQKMIEYIVLKGIEDNEITNIDGSKYVSLRFADPLREFSENNLFTFEIVEKNKGYYIIKTNNNKLLKLKYPPKHPY